MYLPGLMLLVAVIVLRQQSLMVAVSVLTLPAGKGMYRPQIWSGLQDHICSPPHESEAKCEG